ncbi:hypothetical protein [Streptomyces sp. BH105]|uniref:hypothetical protein n=1 Tax=Streptomyces sp. BH105 TaxID=3410408 RepID=UPI003CED2CC4
MKRLLPLENHAATEQITAIAAIVVGTVVGLLAAKTGTGYGNAAGLALFGYIATIGAAYRKVQLSVSGVLAATVKGAVITAVITAVLVFGVWRSAKGLM